MTKCVRKACYGCNNSSDLWRTAHRLVLVFYYFIDGLTGDTSGGTPVNGRRLQRTSYVNKKAVRMSVKGEC